MADIITQDVESNTTESNTDLDCMDIYNTIDIDDDGKVEAQEAVQYILHSKTVWVNLIAMVSFWIQNKYGFVVDESTQLEILSMVNVGLRTFSHNKKIVFKKR